MMKTKLDVFSKNELNNFFLNFEVFFEIKNHNYQALENFTEFKNLSLVFLDDQTDEGIIKKISKKENVLFVCKDHTDLQNFHLNKKQSVICPISTNKLIDFIQNFIIQKKHTFTNIELNNSYITNKKTNERAHLTQAENHILSKILNHKSVQKKTIERDVLQIKSDLNTSSIESHLNRIRKKLKLINSNFTLSSKENLVSLEAFNQDK